MCAPCTPARNSLIIWEPGVQTCALPISELAAESCARPLTLYVGEKGAYDVNIAPDLGRSTAIFSGCSAWHPEFCFVLGTMSARRFNKRTVRPSGELVLPSRSFRMTDYPRTSHSQLTEESVMGIIAWIVLGLAAGLLANMLIPGRRSQGLIVTCVIGIVGALLGGWAASKLFHIHSLQGFFNLSTWLTAIAGAAVLLLAYHLVTGQSGRSRRPRWFAHR